MARTLILAAGNPDFHSVNVVRQAHHRGHRGFTLLELLVVLSIIAIVSVGVGFAMRDSKQSKLERDAQRLASLLEVGRARSQLSGVQVRWRTTEHGFSFDGLPVNAQPDDQLPVQWLDDDTAATVELPAASQVATGLPPDVVLGPDPIIGRQAITLRSRSQPDKVIRLATDGVRPFAVQLSP